MKSTVLFIVNLFCSTLLAQDYILTTKGDTLRGEIKILTFDRLDKVQWKEGKSRATFTALQVRELHLNGELYKPTRYDAQVQFMKVLKPGYLSLMAFRLTNQVTYEGRFLSKMDGTGMEVPNLAFKKAMANFLSDCPEVQQRIKDEKLERKNLDAIIDEYNSCFDQKTIVAQRTRTAAEKSDIVNQLRAKVEAAPDVVDKKDALDLLADIKVKIERGEKIPNYQIDALKNLLGSANSVSTELAAALEALTGA
jgi:hypothetical protein